MEVCVRLKEENVLASWVCTQKECLYCSSLTLLDVSDEFLRIRIFALRHKKDLRKAGSREDLLLLQEINNSSMILSMTGYGKVDAHYDEKKIHIEIKSLNSKALDLTTRIASAYREKELEIRKMVADSVKRGKVELNVWTEKDGGQLSSPINKDAVRAYTQQIRAISAEQGLHLDESALWKLVLRLPDTLAVPVQTELSEAEWIVVRGAVEKALAQFHAFRLQEGAALEKKFREKISNITDLLEAIAPFEQSRVTKIRQQLEERLAELKGVDYDKNRLEQELIYYIEKFDIAEEKQRLTNHLHYFIETLEQGECQGKKLGFIAQEMGREINTTGSKSNQAEMQNIVVRMKDELEQIKEQVLNVL